MAEPRVSIVIPTRNHLGLLKRLLDSLAAQTLPANDFEVIVVDDGSTDGTREFLHTTTFAFPLRVVEQERCGPPRARNAGLALARASIVACMDDDVRLATDCLEKALPYFADENVGIVETTLLIDGADRPLQIHASAQGFVTAAIFFRREAVTEVGGFDPAFFDSRTGLFFRDDADFAFRILEAGYTALQPPDVVAWHPVQFPGVKNSFAHVKRYMFDPLLYKKHPRLFRAYIERKRVGPFSFARPMHYSCLFFVLSIVGGCVFAVQGSSGMVWLCAVAAFIAHVGLRYKFQGVHALKIWRVPETAAYIALPFWYLFWLLRGVKRFGGWKSLF